MQSIVAYSVHNMVAKTQTMSAARLLWCPPRLIDACYLHDMSHRLVLSRRCTYRFGAVLEHVAVELVRNVTVGNDGSKTVFSLTQAGTLSSPH